MSKTETKSWNKGIVLERDYEAVTKGPGGKKHKATGSTREEAERRSQEGYKNLHDDD